MPSEPSDSVPPEQTSAAPPVLDYSAENVFDATVKTKNIRSFADAMEAHLACLAFQGQGIRCEVVGEPVNANLSGYILMKGGGIAVQVMEQDFERAQAILAKIDARRQARIAASKHCPNCGGDQASPAPSSRKRWAFACFVVTIVLLCFPRIVYLALTVAAAGLYLLIFPAASRLHCKACGHSWPEPTDDRVDDDDPDDDAPGAASAS